MVFKTPSPSSRPTQGAGEKSRGHTCGWRFPQGNTTRTPLLLVTEKHLPTERKQQLPLLPNGECTKFREAMRLPFSKDIEHWGASADGGAKPLPSRRAQSTFDTECRKCFCVTFDKSNKTPAEAGYLVKQQVRRIINATDNQRHGRKRFCQP